MLKRLLFFCFFIFMLIGAFAQNRSIGSWKLYLPYNRCIAIAAAPNYIYAATPYSLLKYNKNGEELDNIDKVTGLSEIGIQNIIYDNISKTLIVAYTNSNIDLVTDNNEIININDIKNKIISGDKAIYNLTINEGLAYLSCGFGIAVLDVAKREFKETYYISNTGSNLAIKDVSILNDKIYASTAEGLKYIALNNPGILNYVNWQLASGIDGLPGGGNPEESEVFDHKLFLSLSDTLFSYDGLVWTKLMYEPYWKIKQLTSTSNGLAVCSLLDTSGQITDAKVSVYNSNFVLIDSLRRPNISSPFQILSESDHDFYVADYDKGLLHVQDQKSTTITVGGIPSNNAFGLAVNNNKMYVATGSYDGSFNYKRNVNGFYVYNGTYWGMYSLYTYPILSTVTDVIAITVDPKTERIYASSLYSGLIVVSGDTVSLYDETNTDGMLQPAQGDPGSTRVSDVAIDQKDNVWILNNSAAEPITVWQKDGTWTHQPGVSGINQLKKIIIDQNNQKWILTREGGILVIDEGELNTNADDKIRYLNSSVGNGGLPSEGVFSIAEDKEGSIWVGTSAGIGVFACASSVFNTGGCDAQKIIVERDGYSGYLFSTQAVIAIAVDGANRKWIGTSGGVWLLSSDGKEELLHFNTANSPMPSNEVYDIAINDKTGEVLIATSAGMIGYLGDATKGSDVFEDVLVYPNPVAPDYSGPIAIKGLADDAYFKITDIGGGLIYEGNANGGTAIWDGKNYNGTKAKTGVYIVYSLGQDGKSHYATKIVFIK